VEPISRRHDELPIDGKEFDHERVDQQVRHGDTPSTTATSSTTRMPA